MSEIDNDLSADTAHFQACADRQDEDLPAPWLRRVPGSNVWLLAAVVIVVAVLAAIIFSLIAG